MEKMPLRPRRANHADLLPRTPPTPAASNLMTKYNIAYMALNQESRLLRHDLEPDIDETEDCVDLLPSSP
ncbi:hypothetical protein BGZ58_000469 [Dissophora ornata]|nr:hypothetical protein BGZ58_000469 [Dissophora ornata]